MDWVQWVGGLDLPFQARCRVPEDLAPITSRGEEVSPRSARTSRAAVEAIWARAEALYRAGVHPGIQLCVRAHDRVVLDRAIGHARGNAPSDPEDARRVALTTRTPVNVFSAAKAVTAMVVHKLDEQRVLHLEDRICEFIPEFGQKGKERITVQHLLTHRAGLPNLPAESMDLDLLARPEKVIEVLCESELQSAPGNLLAYHAVTGGFILAEVVRRVTGHSIREVLEKEIREPLGLEWLRYGVEPRDVERVALNAVTGPPVPPPLSFLLERALGAKLERIVEMSNDSRFLNAVVPSANVFTTARDMAAFYQCLLNEGELDGVRVFDPRTVQHAINKQTGWEIDLTLMVPIGYSSGFMLGSNSLSLYGWDHPRAFGHLGLSNIFCWADPDRDLVVALLTTGKPIVSPHVMRVFQLIAEIHEVFPSLVAEALS